MAELNNGPQSADELIPVIEEATKAQIIETMQSGIRFHEERIRILRESIVKLMDRTDGD